MMAQRLAAYPVTVAVVDESKSFTVTPLGAPLAKIVRIWLENKATGVGYKVYPEGATAYCTPGVGNLWTSIAGIVVQNVGTVDGNLFVNVVNADTGVVLKSWTFSNIAINATVGTPSEVICDMPTKPLNLRVEAGH
jgi:hypothetical protein